MDAKLQFASQSRLQIGIAYSAMRFERTKISQKLIDFQLKSVDLDLKSINLNEESINFNRKPIGI